MNSLVYAADIKAKNLEHVYRMGAGEGWKDKNIVVKNFLSGCQYPRDIVAGDIIEGPSGERYIVDVIGFKKID
jgi:hypothetical protein